MQAVWRVAALAAVCAGLLACSPGLNWRLVRAEAAPLTLLLPCKPDRASKPVPLGGKSTTLSMVGCEAEGATFALAMADIGDAAQAGAVLAQWQALSLHNMRASTPVLAPAKITGASADPAPVRVQAQGQQADGRTVQSQGVYFARGSRVFQAVIYAPRIEADVADTFFGSIQFE